MGSVFFRKIEKTCEELCEAHKIVTVADGVVVVVVFAAHGVTQQSETGATGTKQRMGSNSNAIGFRLRCCARRPAESGALTYRMLLDWIGMDRRVVLLVMSCKRVVPHGLVVSGRSHDGNCRSKRWQRTGNWLEIELGTHPLLLLMLLLREQLLLLL